MKCKNCNTQNNDVNKFCINCGNKLEADEEQFTSKKCKACGTENELENKFCIGCGSELEMDSAGKSGKNFSESSKKNKKHKNRSYSTQKNLALVDKIKNHKILTISIFLILGYILLQYSYKEPQSNFNTIPYSDNAIPNNTITDTKLYAVASKFVCSCGTCNELPLESCQCPTAQEERAFITNLLNQNNTVDQAVIAVANKYGWLKSQYYPNYKVDKNKVWFGDVNRPINNANNSNNLSASPGLSAVATIADRNLIISQFECPCGQCNIKDLAQCNCSHPRGAIEVKSFIDSQILEKNKSVQQIIQEVENKYGGRKI